MHSMAFRARAVFTQQGRAGQVGVTDARLGALRTVFDKLHAHGKDKFQSGMRQVRYSQRQQNLLRRHFP